MEVLERRKPSRLQLMMIHFPQRFMILLVSRPQLHHFKLQSKNFFLVSQFILWSIMFC